MKFFHLNFNIFVSFYILFNFEVLFSNGIRNGRGSINRFNTQSVRFPEEGLQVFFVHLIIKTFNLTLNFSFKQTQSEAMESLLIRASKIKNVNDMLNVFGAKLDDDGYEDELLTRKRNSFVEQAGCEPELRTVELDSPDDSSTIYFPKCIRVTRCGGCCGPSKLLECVPTKTSYKDIKRAAIRIKRSSGQNPSSEASQVREKVEVHEECKCQCKVQPNQCDPILHRYRSDVCKCQCLNENQESECQRQSAYKIWDSQTVSFTTFSLNPQ